MIGVDFVGMEKFTLKDLDDVKKIVKKTKMTMKGFRFVMEGVAKDYDVDEQTAFNVTQYCVINRNG